MYCPFMGVNFSRLEEDHGNLLLDKGTNIVNVGKKGWIILDANSGSTGYQWELTPDNSKTYKLVDNFYLPSYTGAVGTPGKSIWIIQAIRPGQGSILLVYKRPYPTETDEKQIVFKIDVK